MNNFHLLNVFHRRVLHDLQQTPKFGKKWKRLSFLTAWNMLRTINVAENGLALIVYRHYRTLRLIVDMLYSRICHALLTSFIHIIHAVHFFRENFVDIAISCIYIFSHTIATKFNIAYVYIYLLLCYTELKFS